MKLLLNGTQYAIAGHVRARIDGRLCYTFNGEERCAWIGGPDGPREQVDPRALTELGESITESFYVLNVEKPGQSVGLCIDILETLRAAATPGTMFGLWSILPASNYYTLANYAAYRDFQRGQPHDAMPASWWAHPSKGPTFVREFVQWRELNTLQARKLLPHVDFLMPSIYPVVEPPSDKPWMGAREPELMIAECRRLTTKPIIPCWSPRFPGTATLASPAYAKAVIGAAMNYADGLTVWTDTHASPETATTALSMASEFATSEQ